jgi:pimeloyl-CoA synthetase
LEDEESRGLNALVSCSKDDHDYWKGYVTALRWCYHRPQKVIELAEKAQKETHGK